MRPQVPILFQSGDRLGDYQVVEVLSRGYFSYNLVVANHDGDYGHAVVHWRQEEKQEITRKGLQFEMTLVHHALPRIKDIGSPCEETGQHMWFVRELLPPPLSNQVFRTEQPLS